MKTIAMSTEMTTSLGSLTGAACSAGATVSVPHSEVCTRVLGDAAHVAFGANGACGDVLPEGAGYHT